MPWSSAFQWAPTGARWLVQHPVLSTLLLFVLPVGLACWHFSLRAYALAASSRTERERIISPAMLGPFASSLGSFPVQHPWEDFDLAPFGQWLMPGLQLRGTTVPDLARELGYSTAAIHAVVYGVPVGIHLPSAMLVDAICAHLDLDQNEGHAAFYRLLNDTQPGNRSTRG